MKYVEFLLYASALLVLCTVAPALADISAGAAGGEPSSGYSVGFSQVAVAVPVPAPMQDDWQSGNFSKLLIAPQYLSFSLDPGNEKELTFTVTNRGSDPVTLTPRFIDTPYSGVYAMDSAWLSVTPSQTEIAPGEKARFTVTMTAPADSYRGYYSGQIALTDEQYPSPYVSPYPNYAQVVSISTEIVAMPGISILPSIVGGSLEAGKSYDYEVILKNNAAYPISVSPILENGMYPVPIFNDKTGITALTDDAITISGPAVIPARGEATLNIHLNVPADAGGYYNGMINLGIDDPSVRDGEGRVQLVFMIWKQPSVPFSCSFTMKDDAPLMIELTASRDMYGYPVSTGTAGRQEAEPSFDLTIHGPDGTLTPQPVKTVIKGSVDLSMGNQYMTGTGTGPYQESGIQYISTYSMPGKAGTWELAIMPYNMARFEYVITMGPAGDMEIIPALSSTTLPVTEPVLNLTSGNSSDGVTDRIRT
jgi:hypothetical protein